LRRSACIGTKEPSRVRRRSISPPVWRIVIVTICSREAPAATRFIMVGIPVVARDMPIIAFDVPVIVLDAPAAPAVAISAARIVTLDVLATRLVAFGVPATRFLALDALATWFLALDVLATRFLVLDVLATRFLVLDALATWFLARATRFITLDAPAAWVGMLWVGTSVVRWSRPVAFVGVLRYVSSARDQSLNPIEPVTKLAFDAIKLIAKRLDLTLQSGGRQFCVELFLGRTAP